MAAKKKTKKKTETKRRQAKPFLSRERMKLTVHNKEPGYFYYWAGETDIPVLLERDYSFVQDPDIKVGDDEKGNISQTSAVKRDGGGGKTLHLMRIKQAWYDQDRNAEERALKTHEKHIYNPEDERVYVKQAKIKHGEYDD